MGQLATKAPMEQDQETKKRQARAPSGKGEHPEIMQAKSSSSSQ